MLLDPHESECFPLSSPFLVLLDVDLICVIHLWYKMYDVVLVLVGNPVDEDLMCCNISLEVTSPMLLY